MEMPQKYEDLSPTRPNFGFIFNEQDAFGEPDLYLEAANGSESQSPDSPYQKYVVPYFPEYITSTNVYPSPEREVESPASDVVSLPVSHQPMSATADSISSLVSSSTTANGSSSPSPPATSTAPATKAPAKRKRENRYKNAPPSVLSRRRAQNRASQRAYRERKDQRIKDLEQMLGEAKQRNENLSQAYNVLQSEFLKVKVQFAGSSRPSMAAATTMASPISPTTPTSAAASISMASAPTLMTGFDPTTAATIAMGADRLDADPLYSYHHMGTYAM